MSFKKDLVKSLLKKNKIIPSKYHYDFQGSKYFEKITKQKEYYLTRKEKEILKTISKKVPPIFFENLSFVELGSGASDKISILLNKKVKFYLPLDISLKFIKQSSRKLKKKYPNLIIKPFKVDYSKPFKIPKINKSKKVCFFLGSSIGNFHNNEEIKFLNNIYKSIGNNNYLFIGVDLLKNKKIIETAYNDKAGYSAKFNLNLIDVINKKFFTNINKNDFSYMSKFNSKKKCMQSFIVSKKFQSFKIDNKVFFLKKNEPIQTEISKKFTISSFHKLAISTNWKVCNYWLDKKAYYSIFLLKS